MSQIVEFVGDDDAIPVLFQVTPPYEDIEPVGRLENAINRLQASFRGSLDIVRQVATDFAATLDTSHVESAEIEFSLQLTATGKLCIVEGQAHASIKVNLKVVPAGATG